MRKIFTIIILLCGIVGNSWAVCELTESTDRTPSDEDLYPQDPNVSRMALICQKGKCEDGEIIYVRGSHYKKNRLIENGGYYRCKLGGNDRWLEAQPSDIRTTGSYIAPTWERPLIEYDDNKGLFVYGTRATDGNYYKNLLYVEPDERCGLKCVPNNEGKYVYCDGKLHSVDRVVDMPMFMSNTVPNTFCLYSDPETRISGRIESFDRGNYMYVVFGDRLLQNGDVFADDGTFCTGCYEGGYFTGENGFSGACCNEKDEAWCKWRKNKEGKNTEWKDDKCKCLDNGMEWDTEKHDCVKSGKGGRTGAGSTGSGKTGGSGSGKTGGGSSGKGKIGSGKADEKCGVKCNAKNSGKHFYCDGGIYYCYEDSNTYAFLVSINNLLAPCEYTDPLTTVYKIETSFVASYKEASNVKFFGKRALVDGEEVRPESKDFCMGCRKGLFFEPIDCSSESSAEKQVSWDGYHKYWDFVYGGCSTDGACIDNLDRAWCYWQKVKANMNVEWSGDNGCKCLDDGKVWDPKTHNCIADTGGKTPPQPKDKKIDCVIELGASVRCKDGTGFDKTTTLSITSEKCDLYKSNIAKYLNEITQTLCANHGGLGDVLSNQEIKDAAARIDNFMKYAESNPSVWKNAEGKFNTARLASDATAGVILGTVGGIVSAHVIKKKQVEKGFDSLHCTVGGQTVADLGDEFRVGLGK